MLTLLEPKFPEQTGDHKKDYENLVAALKEWFRQLNRPDALVLERATLDGTPIGANEASTGEFTNLTVAAVDSPLVLNRVDAVNEGGELRFNRSSDNAAGTVLDVASNNFRIINTHATAEVSLWTNTTQRLTVNTTTVTSTLSSVAPSFVPSGSTVPSNGMYLPAANTLGWAINSAATMSLDSGTLEVGGGTTSSRLSTIGTLTLRGLATTTTLDNAGVMTTPTAGLDVDKKITAAAFVPDTSTIPTNGLYLPAANNPAIAVNSAKLASFAANGVGVGRDPVASDMGMAVQSAGTTARYRLGNTSNADAADIAQVATDLYVYNLLSGNMFLGTNNATRVTVNSGGQVGIPTASTTTMLALAAGTTGVSSLRVPHGSAPSSPVNGDIWTTTAGLFVRINGATVGPLS